jgi:drug/metabolite transporter (DMT)-like permease
MERIGELAAFGTAICWMCGALLFERGIKHIGVLAVNFYKVIIASVLLIITGTIMRGMPLPLDAPLNAWIYLTISGFVGFTIADIFLFSAYDTVGPRIAMLFMAIAPPMTAGIAYLFLGESLGPRSLIGMILVLSGIVMTVFARSNSLEFAKIAREDRRGYIFAFFASLAHAVGMNLTKIGVTGYDAVSGTQIRAFAAIIGFGLVSLFFHRGKNLKNALKSSVGLKYTAIGAFFGPFLGVVLSLYALQRVSPGIVSTLIGLTPILILVPELLIFKKKIRALEIAGAIVAVSGTMFFFL